MAQPRSEHRPRRGILDRLEEARGRCRDESIAEYLLARATGQIAPQRARLAARRQCVNVGPSQTIREVDLDMAVRKFSPSGEYLVAFAKNGQSLLLHRVAYTCPPGPHEAAAADGNARLAFARSLFPLASTTALCKGPNQALCKDFCLFTPDATNDHVIVASTASHRLSGSSSAEESAAAATAAAGHNHASSARRHRRMDNRSSHSLPVAMSSCENVTLHVVATATGIECDRITFPNDHILLANHGGVSMNGRRLAVLSLQHQVIRIFYITAKGRLVLDGVVGDSLHGDDELLVGARASGACPASSTCPAGGGEASPPPLVGLKQRLFAFLHQQAAMQPSSDSPPEGGTRQAALRSLYFNWHTIEALCMVRFQFLDSTRLLIKLACPESLFPRSQSLSDEGLHQTAFFLIYSLASKSILSFHRSTSKASRHPPRRPSLPRMANLLLIATRSCMTSPSGTATTFASSPPSTTTATTIAGCHGNVAPLQTSTRGNSGIGTLSSSPQRAQTTGWSMQSSGCWRPCHTPPRCAPRRHFSTPPSFAMTNVPSLQSSGTSRHLTDRLALQRGANRHATIRHRNVSEGPIRFFSRLTDAVKFRLCSGPDGATQAPSSLGASAVGRSKKYAQWIFHPYLPLALSSQHTLIKSTTYNIHIKPAALTSLLP